VSPVKALGGGHQDSVGVPFRPPESSSRSPTIDRDVAADWPAHAVRQSTSGETPGRGTLGRQVGEQDDPNPGVGERSDGMAPEGGRQRNRLWSLGPPRRTAVPSGRVESRAPGARGDRRLPSDGEIINTRNEP
jgi:hypothetical protein